MEESQDYSDDEVDSGGQEPTFEADVDADKNSEVVNVVSSAEPQRNPPSSDLQKKTLNEKSEAKETKELASQDAATTFSASLEEASLALEEAKKLLGILGLDSSTLTSASLRDKAAVEERSSVQISSEALGGAKADFSTPFPKLSPLNFSYTALTPPPPIATPSMTSEAKYRTPKHSWVSVCSSNTLLPDYSVESKDIDPPEPDAASLRLFPMNAVIGGKCEHPLYVCRVKSNGAIVIGQASRVGKLHKEGVGLGGAGEYEQPQGFECCLQRKVKYFRRYQVLVADPQSICWVKCSLTSSSSRYEVVETSRTGGGHPGTQSGTQSQSSLEELIGGKISSSRTLRALVAGMTSRGRPMYIGRVSCSSGIYIGHIDPDQATCFYPCRGVAEEAKLCEVLCLASDFVSREAQTAPPPVAPFPVKFKSLDEVRGKLSTRRSLRQFPLSPITKQTKIRASDEAKRAHARVAATSSATDILMQLVSGLSEQDRLSFGKTLKEKFGDFGGFGHIQLDAKQEKSMEDTEEDDLNGISASPQEVDQTSAAHLKTKEDDSEQATAVLQPGSNGLGPQRAVEDDAGDADSQQLNPKQSSEVKMRSSANSKTGQNIKKTSNVRNPRPKKLQQGKTAAMASKTKPRPYKKGSVKKTGAVPSRTSKGSAKKTGAAGRPAAKSRPGRPSAGARAKETTNLASKKRSVKKTAKSQAAGVRRKR